MEGTTNVAELPVPPPQVSLANVMGIPAVRQLLALVGIAASVAAGLAVFNWSQKPEFTAVYQQLEARDAAAVAASLDAAGIEYEINRSTGAVEVRSDQVYRARMQLAAQGLPQSANIGMADIGEGAGFGTSQFAENARYNHALEMELSSTIKSLRAVQNARVHLAMPKQSAFIRDQQRPSASVLLQLYGRGGLEASQAQSIVNLVATSIPGMRREDVTLVDQNGTLLSQQDSLSDEAITATQFNMTRSLEDDYKRRIMAMLTTLVGPGAVRAQVTADLDFTITEQTRESYDPASQVVRSEQINEQQRAASDVANGGVPGALANTPPQAGGNANPLGGANEQAIDSSRSATRNFEVDRTLSKTRAPTGTIRRLSVAVLIDEAALTRTVAAAADGDAEAADPATRETVTIDLDEVTALVREAVGFSAARGDTVEVISQPFLGLETPMEDSGPPIWENPVLRELAKQGLGVILALAVAFGIVRPMLKSIVEAPPAPTATLLPDQGAGISGQLDGPGESSNTLTYDEKVAAARNITSHDPARVAQVVRRWIEADGE